MKPAHSPSRPHALRYAPLCLLAVAYLCGGAGLFLSGAFSEQAGHTETLPAPLGWVVYAALLLSLLSLLATPILAWVAVRTQQARLLNIGVLTLAVFHLLSMFLA